MSFYGNLTDSPRTVFHFDKIYNNKTEMDNAIEMNADTIFPGRYALISYGVGNDYDNNELADNPNPDPDIDRRVNYDATVWQKTTNNSYRLICHLDSSGVIEMVQPQGSDFINKDGFDVETVGTIYGANPIIKTSLIKNQNFKLGRLKFIADLRILGDSFIKMLNIIFGNGEDNTGKKRQGWIKWQELLEDSDEAPNFLKYGIIYIVEWYKNIKNEWTSYLASKEAEWVQYKENKDEDWVNYKASKDVNWNNYKNDKNTDWTDYKNNKDADWSSYKEDKDADWIDYKEDKDDDWADYKEDKDSNWKLWYNSQATQESQYGQVQREWEDIKRTLANITIIDGGTSTEVLQEE